MTMEYTFDEAKTTVFEDGHYTVEHYNTLIINNPMQVASVSETDDTPLHSYFLQRVVPTTIGYYIEIGTFTVTGGAHSIQVDISVGETNFSITKKYLLTVKYSLTSGTWVQVEPISSTGPYINNDFSLDVNVAANETSLRIRRAGSNTAAGTARIYLVDVSRTSVDGYSFVGSSGTGNSGVGGGSGSIPSLETTSGGIPVGSIVSWIGGYFGLLNSSYTPILQTTDTVVAANVFLNPKGWYVCDGSAPNLVDSPIWNASNRYLPNLTDSRFLMGAATITSTANGGSNTLSDHTHALTGNVVAESGHTHSSAGVTVNIESSHTHDISSMSIGGESSHTHTWGGHWSIENSSDFANDNGDGLGNTFSDALVSWGGGYWSTGGNPWWTTLTTWEQPTHTHTVNDAYFAENRGSGGTFAGSRNSYDNDNDLFTRSITTSGGSHQHEFPLYSHRHWIRTRGTSAGSNHGHSLLGSLGTGSSHAHGLTGSVSAGTSHTHSLTSGSVGSGSLPALTDNRPQYFKTFMIVRVK